MARQQKAPLRAVTADERAALEQVVRAGSERAECVARARALLAVADGATFAAAARAAGRRVGRRGGATGRPLQYGRARGGDAAARRRACARST